MLRTLGDQPDLRHLAHRKLPQLRQVDDDGGPAAHALLSRLGLAGGGHPPIVANVMVVRKRPVRNDQWYTSQSVTNAPDSV